MQFKAHDPIKHGGYTTFSGNPAIANTMLQLSCFNLFLFKGDIVNVIGTTVYENSILPIVRSEVDGAQYIAFID